MLESNNMRIMKRAMDFDFRHQFLFSPVLGKRSLRYYFSSIQFFCLNVRKLIAFSEATFPQESAFDVFFVCYLAIELYYFLLNVDLWLLIFTTC